MATGSARDDELVPLGGALHPSDAGYLGDELLRQKGIAAGFRDESGMLQVLVDSRYLDEARQLRDDLFEEAAGSALDHAHSPRGRSKALTAGAFTTTMGVVLGSRLASNPLAGVSLGLLLGVIAFYAVRSRES